jgi:hypothetical protein
MAGHPAMPTRADPATPMRLRQMVKQCAMFTAGAVTLAAPGGVRRIAESKRDLLGFAFREVCSCGLLCHDRLESCVAVQAAIATLGSACRAIRRGTHRQRFWQNEPTAETLLEILPQSRLPQRPRPPVFRQNRPKLAQNQPTFCQNEPKVQLTSARASPKQLAAMWAS